jgi:hypothetical protein
MPTAPFVLSFTEWLFLRTLELGTLNLDEAESSLARLEALGLATKGQDGWQATDYGKLLSASRRSL